MRIALCFALLISLFLCCPSANVGQKQQDTPAPPETFGVGDVVQVKDHTITLNSAEVSGGILVANFTVENAGDEELIVSSLPYAKAKIESKRFKNQRRRERRYRNCH